MKQLTEAELAWAAGIIDGRGMRILYRKDRNKFEPQVEVKINHLPTCERLESMFGVGIAKKVQYGNYGNKSEVFHWICKTKEEVKTVLRQVRPYLFTKAKIADTILQFCDVSSINVEAEIYDQYKSLDIKD